MTPELSAGEWDSNPWAILGESIVFVKKSHGQTIEFLQRMTIIGTIFNRQIFIVSLNLQWGT